MDVLFAVESHWVELGRIERASSKGGKVDPKAPTWRFEQQRGRRRPGAQAPDSGQYQTGKPEYRALKLGLEVSGFCPVPRGARRDP
jgi:hypothetical protein